ncbi:MAG: PfkB family carbohydrate kinase [Rhizobiaceae bacterium]|jgi:sugar/nucleoside kinase (ribokinase family)|nr:PfkB family carbohydrate kinase [Rhizobiaceae bacterium]
MTSLLVIGGAHVDRLARLSAPHIAATSNPATVSESAGGGALNAARAARRFGIDVALVSARGADAAAAMVESAIRTAGICDLAAIHLDRATPTYTAILEPDGELVTAIADMRLHETAVGKALRRSPVVQAALSADALLIDANVGAVAIETALDLAGSKPVHGLAISAGKVSRFATVLPRLATLFLNRHESAALTGVDAARPAAEHAAALHRAGVRRCVVSAGAGPLAILEHGQVQQVPSPPPVEVADVTGAGDALAGTMVALLMAGATMDEAARHGVAAAALTVTKPGPSPALSMAMIKRLARRIDAPAPVSSQ